MSETIYFTADIMTANDYINHVRTIFQLKYAMSGLDKCSGIRIINNKVHLYDATDNDITRACKWLKGLPTEVELLKKHNSAICDTIVDLETTVEELYIKVCNAVVSNYGSISTYFVVYEDKNLAPSFVYLREFGTQSEADKVELLYKYQYLYDYLNDNYKGDDTILVDYDVNKDRLGFSIVTDIGDSLRGSTVIKDSTAKHLLSTVIFSGSYGVTVKDALSNIETTILYLIRLYGDTFKSVYDWLQTKQEDTFSEIVDTQEINYLGVGGFVTFGDNVYSVYVSSGRLRNSLNRLNYMYKVNAFLKAVYTRRGLLDFPITNTYVTVASAIQSYLKYQYESEFKFSVDAPDCGRYDSYACLLMSANSVSPHGYVHIHQSLNMYLIHYHNSVVSTANTDKLDMLLTYMDYCKDTYVVDCKWDSKHTISVPLLNKDKELIDVSDYIQQQSFSCDLDIDNVKELLHLSRSLIKSFYNTLNLSYPVVFIDALNGFRMISSIAESSDTKYITLDYEINKYLNCNTNYMGTIKDDSVLTCSDMVFPIKGKYTVWDLQGKDNHLLYDIVVHRYYGMTEVMQQITDKVLSICHELTPLNIKTVSIGVEDIKNYTKLSFIVKTYSGLTKTYTLDIREVFSHAVYSLFHVDSGYQIYDATLQEVYTILSELVEMIEVSYNFVGFDESINSLKHDVNTSSLFINSIKYTNTNTDKEKCEEVDESDVIKDLEDCVVMKVVQNNSSGLVRSETVKNKELAKDLALEFIDSGYDVIMRDGEDLVVYSSTDNSLQEYVPKSLQNIFYDVDKLDLLPLTYYVYMCK